MSKKLSTQPDFCYGNEHNQTHAKGCRPARPLCRWMRSVQKVRQVCKCDAYHFPHRFSGGRCQHPEKMEAWVLGPKYKERPSSAYISATVSDLYDDIPF